MQRKAITTTVVGSYTVPDWYSVLQSAVEKKDIKPEIFEDAKSIAVRAAIKDQETVGIDIVSDGELFRRNNNCFGPPNAMISYFAKKIPGFSPELRPKTNITPVAPEASLPAPVVVSQLQPVSLGLTEELKFLRQYTKHKVKIAMTGPHMFARVVWNEHYPSEKDLAMDMAKIINSEFRKLDKAGCDVIQLDEPILWFLSGDQEWGIEAINECFKGIHRSKKALHICQGNYNPNPEEHKGIRIFPAEFKNIFPVIQQADVDIIVMAFTSLKVKDLTPLENFPKDKILGVGCIDVQNHSIERPKDVAATLRRVLKYIPRKRIFAHPDCGLNHLSREIAYRKLQAMIDGVKLV